MPTQGHQLGGAPLTLDRLFRETDPLFRVPEFQRQYVWRTKRQKAQIPRLWQDVMTTAEARADDPSASLFLGAIVNQALTTGGPGETPVFSIIDGQQRLMSLYLLLCAISEGFDLAGDEEAARQMERQYLLIQMEQHQNQPRISPATRDSAQFHKILSHLKHPSPVFPHTHGDSNGMLIQAWEYLRKQIHLQAGIRITKVGVEFEADTVARLKGLRDAVLLGLQCVHITLSDDHDVHTVYERLNYLNERLTTLDLLRNAVFMPLGNDLAAAAEVDSYIWTPFEKSLAEKHQGYFYPFALIRSPKVNSEDVYGALMDHWRGKFNGFNDGINSSRKIVKDLSEYVPAYLAVLGDRPTDSNQLAGAIDGKVTDSVWGEIDRLRRIELPEMMRPYFMELIRGHLSGDVTAAQLKSVILVVESFIIRRIFAGDELNAVQATFRTLWPEVQADRKALAAVLRDELNFSGDDEFRHNVAIFPLYSLRKRKTYVVAEYDRGFSEKKKGDPIRTEPGDISCDHLMPQNRGLEWQHISDATHDRYLHTWANLVPMTTPGNASKSNKTWWDGKRLHTQFASTAAVYDRYPDRWNEETLEERANELADWAVSRWPGPPKA